MCPEAEVAASGKVKEIKSQEVSTDKEEKRIKKIEFLQLLAHMATSRGHFSRPLGMGSFWR